jgi:hypothetical protein
MLSKQFIYGHQLIESANVDLFKYYPSPLGIGLSLSVLGVSVGLLGLKVHDKMIYDCWPL